MRVSCCEGVKVYHSKSRDAACLDVSQHHPGGAVAHSEGPAADDDPLGSTESTDVLSLHGMADSNVSLHSEG